MDNENKMTKQSLSFLAIDQYITSNIVKPVEKAVRGRDFIIWGENNDYPEYLEYLYDNVTTLKSIVDGTTDYICGDSITTNVTYLDRQVNKRGDTIYDIVRWIAKDLVKYNGFALNIVKSKLGTIAEIYYLDFKRIRSNEDGTKYYYSTDWDKSYGRVKYTEYDSYYNKEATNSMSTILYVKNDINKTYPAPIYAAATIACEIEIKMNTYHLNNITNSFSSNYIINFNNGRPSDELKQEIEDDVYEKFCGVENSGRPMLCFNDTHENETTIQKVDTDSFIDKYNTLADRTRQEIFTSFRCSPILFGIDQEKTGFNANEYAETFRLYNKTVVQPFQNVITRTFDKLFGIDDSIVIEPFKINFDKEANA